MGGENFLGFLPEFVLPTVIFSYILWSIFLNERQDKLKLKTPHDLLDIVGLTSLNLFFLISFTICLAFPTILSWNSTIDKVINSLPGIIRIYSLTLLIILGVISGILRKGGDRKKLGTTYITVILTNVLITSIILGSIAYIFIFRNVYFVLFILQFFIISFIIILITLMLFVLYNAIFPKNKLDKIEWALIILMIIGGLIFSFVQESINSPFTSVESDTLIKYEIDWLRPDENSKVEEARIREYKIGKIGDCGWIYFDIKGITYSKISEINILYYEKEGNKTYNRSNKLETSEDKFKLEPWGIEEYKNTNNLLVLKVNKNKLRENLTYGLDIKYDLINNYNNSYEGNYFFNSTVLNCKGNGRVCYSSLYFQNNEEAEMIIHDEPIFFYGESELRRKNCNLSRLEVFQQIGKKLYEDRTVCSTSLETCDIYIPYMSGSDFTFAMESSYALYAYYVKIPPRTNSILNLTYICPASSS